MRIDANAGGWPTERPSAASPFDSHSNTGPKRPQWTRSARRTFFNYFPGKDNVFSIEPHQCTTEEIVAEPRSRPAGEAPVESMRVVVRAMADAADFARSADEWELPRELHRRCPALFARTRVDQADITIAALVKEIAARTGARSDLAFDLLIRVL